MNEYIPDRWVIIEGNYEGEIIQHVLAGWWGGYTESDRWRISSGITKVSEFPDRYEFLNESGSNYVCYKVCYGYTSYSASILESYKKLQPELNLTVVKSYEKL